MGVFPRRSAAQTAALSFAFLERQNSFTPQLAKHLRSWRLFHHHFLFNSGGTALQFVVLRTAANDAV